VSEDTLELPYRPAVPYSATVREAPTVDLSRLAPSLGDCCDGYLEGYRGRFEADVRRGASGVDAASSFSRALDGLLGALYCAADAAAGPTSDARVALVAVGGYGRGLVGLGSDVDVLFLCDDPSDPRVRALAEGLLYPLWDLGMEIGHAVRGQEETLALAREDIRTATTLIDLRRVAGDESIVADLGRAARRAIFEPHLDEFLDALEEDTLRRHDRFGDSLYLLEPDVKNGSGGLRDLDVAEWAARARWDARSSQDYVRTGALLEREVDELETAREMLWRVRNLLHLRAQRQQDRLTFADQEEIAQQLGFVDGITLGVEQFMQAYYRHARVVAQTAERMLMRARPRRRKTPATQRSLGDGTAIFDGHLTLDDPDDLQRDPTLALRLYKQVLAQRLPPLPLARDAIARDAVGEEWREELRSSREAADTFLELFTTTDRGGWERGPLSRASLLDELHEVGLTVALIPEFEPLTGRVQHDVFHVYTVDIHAIRAVERLRAIVAGERIPHLALANRLGAEITRRLPVFLATFLHALGKVHGHGHGMPEEREGERSAAMVRPVAERLGLRPIDVDHLVWLLQEQGSLYFWATKRDTSDPEVLEEVARRVGSLERLRDLYLMTVSILSTVNPRSLTDWTARMLEDLYFGVARVLEGRGGPAAGRAAQLRTEVKVGFTGDRGEAILERFVDAMPERYILANPVDVIRRHARVVRDAAGERTVVALGPGPSEDVSELLVVASDRAGLLADVTAVFARHRVAVIDAQIFTLPGDPDVGEARDRAVQTFAVRRESGGRLDRDMRARVESDLRAVVDGDVSAAEMVAQTPRAPSWARRPGPEVATEVRIDNKASASFTIVDVVTRDRPGVLYSIARTLHEEGLFIALSKITTEGDRVTDVFYVNDTERGAKVDDLDRLRHLERLLTERLESA